MALPEAMEGVESRLELLDLPEEVLEYALCLPMLDHRDVCHCAATCHKLRRISASNSLWRMKYFARWPYLMESFSRVEQPHNWLEAFKQRYVCERKVREFVAGMSHKYFLKDEVSQEGFADLRALSSEPNFIVEELLRILNDGHEKLNLTEKYYGAKALRHMHLTLIRKDWQDYLSLPPEQQLLETGAILLAQWFQPTERISAQMIYAQLDDIADEVRDCLRSKYPDHPAAAQLDRPVIEVRENLWSPHECRVALETLNHVLYEEQHFHGNQEEYYNPNNSYINKVLELRMGIPISLAVVYISVAKRLGIVCEPVNFPSHFLIKFKEHPMKSAQQYTYIDVFNQGRFRTEDECAEILEMPYPHPLARDNYHCIPPVKVLERMARNLVNIGRQISQMGDGMLALRSAVELFTLLVPEDMDSTVLLTRLYIHLGINLTEVVHILQELETRHNAPAGLLAYLKQTAEESIAEEASVPQPEPIDQKLRTENEGVKYSVGLIMKHRRYDYTCVIYGWDKQCEATQEWILKMNVHNLPKKQFQPFYNVLVEDGSNRYAAQENLEMAEQTKAITHPEVGRHFVEYRDTHYWPNAEKLFQYPEDMPQTLQYCAEKYPTANNN